MSLKMVVLLVFRDSELKKNSLFDIRDSELKIDSLRLDFEVSIECKNII